MKQCATYDYLNILIGRFQALDEQLEELLKMVMRTQVYIHYPDMGML